MAFASIAAWLEAAANNVELDGISLAENVMRPPAVNNAFRELMAQVAEWTGDDAVASATTTDISAVPAQYVTVSGTTTITGLGTVKAGWVKFVKFSGVLTLTHNATSLILPGAANIVTAADDTAIFVSLGSGNWQCISYQRSSTAPGIPAGAVVNSWYTDVVTYFSGAAVIPIDDTPPTATEGVSFLSVTTGTLKSSTNKLRMRFSGVIGADAVGAVVASILINGAPASRSAFAIIRTAGDVAPLSCEYEYTPGATTSVTISVRCGAQTGNLRVNGTTARLFGGALGLSLVVEEIKA